MSNRELSPPPDGGVGTQIIYILITIDTDLVLQRAPSLDKDAAVPTSIPQEQGFMLVTSSEYVINQTTSEATCEAKKGDIVRIFVKSGSNQFEDAVVLYKVGDAQGNAILKNLALETRERPSVAPASATSPLPAQIITQPFSFCECVVMGEGTERISFIFAIYDSDDDGQPCFAGLYQWQAQITFYFPSSSTKTTTERQEKTS